MESLSQLEARAHILARQGLSKPFSSPLAALHGIFAIQTQYASSLPIALALRTPKLQPTWHQRDEHRDVLKSWTLRSTLHAHTAEDHAIAVAALRDRLRTRYIDWFKREIGFDDRTIANMEDAICKALEGGPLTRVQLHDRVPDLRKIPFAGWGLDLKGLAYAGRIKLIVQERGATLFARHEIPTTWTKLPAIQALMRRYFSAFGPATVQDFRYWSGLFAADIKAALEGFQDELTELEVEGLPGPHFVYGPIEQGKIPKVVLLAKFDPLTLGHFDKQLFLAPSDRERVFRKAGQVEAGILIDGRFAGTWRVARKGQSAEIMIEPFRKISKSNLPAIQRESKRVAKSLGLKQVELRLNPQS